MDERAPAALAEIRSLELEMARRLDDARTRTRTEVDEASMRARQRVADARGRGAEQADAHYQDCVASASAESERIRLTGERDAAELLDTLRPRLDGLVGEMLDLVLTTTNRDGR